MPLLLSAFRSHCACCYPAGWECSTRLCCAEYHVITRRLLCIWSCLQPSSKLTSNFHFAIFQSAANQFVLLLLLSLKHGLHSCWSELLLRFANTDQQADHHRLSLLIWCVQDLSAKFAGIIFGLTNGLSSIVEAFSIYGTGLILDSRHSWPLVFEIVAGINVLGGLFYIFFASSKPQSW